MKYDPEGCGFDPDDPLVVEAIRYLEENEEVARVFGVMTADQLFVGDGFWTPQERSGIIDGMEAQIRETYASITHEPLAREPLFVEQQILTARRGLIERYGALKAAAESVASTEGGH